MNKAKIALITGASQGIGEATAIKLATKNYHPILIARSLSKLKKVETKIKATGKTSSIYQVDISNQQEIKHCIKDVITRFNKIDLLLNNAGIAHGGTSKLELHKLQQMINVNLIGAICVANEVAAQMKKQKNGYIINISSVSGKRAEAAVGGYSASKFGLAGYSTALQQELIDYGIRVTTIYPRVVNTPMTKNLIERTKIDPKLLLQPEDIANIIDFLVSQSENVVIEELTVNSCLMLKKSISEFISK